MQIICFFGHWFHFWHLRIEFFKSYPQKIFAPVKNARNNTATALFTLVYITLIAAPHNLAGLRQRNILMQYRSISRIQSTTILVHLLPIFPRYRPKSVHTLRYYCLATTWSQSQEIAAKLYNITPILHENIATCKPALIRAFFQWQNIQQLKCRVS